MLSGHVQFLKPLLALTMIGFLSACGGSGSDTTAATGTTSVTRPVTGSVMLRAPVLSFNDTGISVTDGVTQNGLWAVDSAGIDVSRMLVYGHMGPSDLGRNLLANVPKTALGKGAMTLWFQQTGLLPTQYALEVVLGPAN